MININPEQGTYKKLTPFKLACLQNFPYIEADFDALTNYQLMCKIVEYLNSVISNENVVEENVSNLYNAFISLRNYIDTYFGEELQEKVNNKLDEMADDGTLEDLISNYIDDNVQRVYNSLELLKQANLDENIKVRTLGYYSINDGGGATYVIKRVMPTGYYELLDNGMYAELIIEDGTINLNQIGCYGDGVHDDSTKINDFINNLVEDEEIKIILLTGKKYVANIEITSKTKVIFDGYGTLVGTINFNYNQRKYAFNQVRNITIDNQSTNRTTNGINIKYCYNLYLYNVKFNYCDKAINFVDINDRHSGRICISNCIFSENKYELFNNNETSGRTSWQVADVQFLNNQLLNSRITGIFLRNIDGLICKNNVFFTAGFQSQDQDKECNIDIYNSNFTIIEGNNLFEAGYHSIKSGKFQNLSIQNNTIDWCGQRTPSAGVYLYGNTTNDIANSVISNNIFNSPSKYGIDISCLIRGLTITGNSFVFDSNNAYYYGTETIELTSRKTINIPEDYKTSNILVTNNNYYNWEEDIKVGTSKGSVKVRNNLSKKGIVNKGYSVSTITDSAWSGTTMNLKTNETFLTDKVIIPAERTNNLTIQCIATPTDNFEIEIYNLNSNITVSLSQTDVQKTKTGQGVTILPNTITKLKCYNGVWYEI